MRDPGQVGSRRPQCRVGLVSTLFCTQPLNSNDVSCGNVFQNWPKAHLSDTEQWSRSSGSNVIPRQARPGLAGLRPHALCATREPSFFLSLRILKGYFSVTGSKVWGSGFRV